MGSVEHLVTVCSSCRALFGMYLPYDRADLRRRCYCRALLETSLVAFTDALFLGWLLHAVWFCLDIH
jgi:hypothetical protein